MSDTILDMDYRIVDILNSNQLEIGDLIGLDGEVVKVNEITPLRFGFLVTYENEFGEKDVIEFADDEKVDLFILE